MTFMLPIVVSGRCFFSRIFRSRWGKRCSGWWSLIGVMSSRCFLSMIFWIGRRWSIEFPGIGYFFLRIFRADGRRRICFRWYFPLIFVIAPKRGFFCRALIIADRLVLDGSSIAGIICYIWDDLPSIVRQQDPVLASSCSVFYFLSVGELAFIFIPWNYVVTVAIWCL